MSKLTKDNCFANRFPEIAKQCHPFKNNGLNPTQVPPHSHKKVWWQCEKGHEWMASFNNRSKGQSCPYCVGTKLLKENSLALKRPDLIREWDYDKNTKINPEEVFELSNFKVWWKCSRNHSFFQVISKRSNRGTGCPYCSGRLPTKENCLLTKYPKLCEEWDFIKNKFTPENITAHSVERVFWKCKKGHEWEARLDSRVRGHTNCPYCRGITLKDGTLCDSKAEAVKYIEFREKGVVFEHHKKYYTKLGCKKTGKLTYDFYFLNENKYIETTSYNKDNLDHIPGRYFRYLRNIVKKRRFAEDILGAKFEFIQFIPTKEQLKKVRENML